MRPHWLSAVFITAFLPSCAGVTFTPLQPDGIHPIAGAASGLPIPMFRPYLIVAAIPPATTTKSPQDAPGAAPAAAAAAAPSTPANTASKTSTPPATGTATSEMSFQASSTTYNLKLIYLPDYSHTTAVSVSTGLFGTASVQLSLQDGQLNSVSANADNTKLADVLTSLLQTAAGGATGGASTAATKAVSASKAAAAAPGGAAPAPSKDAVLAPGFYAFNYIDGQSRPNGLCALTYFDSDGSHPAPSSDPGTCPASVPRPAMQ